MNTAIVTGGSRGIGMGIVRLLLKKDYNVVISSRNINDEVKELIKTYGERVLFVPSDIGSAEDRRKIVETALEKYGEINLLVNNAGVAPRVRRDMLEITEDDYDFVMNINLKGSYFLTQAVAREMVKNGGGRIINTGSISSDTVSLNRAEYCMSKAGVRMMTDLFAARLAEYNIGVFEISPGVIDTPMIEKVRDKYNRLAETGVIPARRLGTPDDIANAVEAVADGRLDYATGTVIRCDGGLHIATL